MSKQQGFRLFKTTYKDRKGRTKESAKWYCEFRDHLDAVRRLPASASKAASEELGRNLVKLVAYHKASGGQTDPALTRWLTCLPRQTREKLVAIGLLAPERVGTHKTLTEHLDDFGKALTAKGSSSFHVEVVTGRARKIIDGCAFKFHADINASKVMAFLDELRKDTAEKRGMSAQTFNFYLSAIKQFCKWMVKDRRAVESPVAHLAGLNVKLDRRRDRCALAVGELVRLLDAARNGPDRDGMTGPERGLLYWLAVETGLRAGELRSLTRLSFALGCNPATVTVDAAYSKHRREDTLPLRPELAEALRLHLATLAPATPAFRIPTERKTAARMFRADVEAAGLTYRDDAGRVRDFHCLRHTFITNLANGGVHPKVAQALARHSTITLTMDRYSHTLLGEQTEALDALPDLTAASQQMARKNGTDNARGGQTVLASCLALSARPESTSVGADGRNQRESVESQAAANVVVSAAKTAPGSVCTSGGGPGLQNQWTA